MASNQTAADDIDSLVSQLTDISKSLRSGTPLDTERTKVLGLAKDLTTTLTLPHEEVYGWITVYCQITAIRLFINWGVFEAIPEQGDITLAALAAKVNVDPDLLIRYIHILLTTSTLLQTSPTPSFAHTPRSLVHATRTPLRSMTETIFDMHLPALLASPAFYSRFGAVPPTSQTDTVLSLGQGRLGVAPFTIINESSEGLRQAFMQTMQLTDALYPFLEGYDLSWAVPSATPSPGSGPVIVDLGGGAGHALPRFLASTPGLRPAHYCLQDAPSVLAAAAGMNPALRDARLVPVDFFAEPPVAGATVYYLRRILHDYSDDACVEILKRVESVMRPESRVLVVEMVLDPGEFARGGGRGAFMAVSNIIMTNIGGKERTLAEFEAVLKRAGLKVRKVWENGKEGMQGRVIEAVRKGFEG